MANVDINFKTTADTSGAAATVDALEDVEKKVDDVAESSAEADDDLKRLVNIERARVIADVGQIFGKVANAVGMMRRELGGANGELDKTLVKVETGLDAVGGGLAGAAQGFAVGGPLGAAIGGFIGLASGPLKTAINGMVTDLKAAAEGTRLAEISEANYQKALAARKEKLKELGFSNFWANELAKIEAATAALRRQNAEIESRRQTDDARRESGQSAAAAAGAPRADVARADIIGDLESRLAEIEQKESAAQAALAALGQAATDAQLKATDAAEKDLADADKLAGEAKAARSAAEAGKLDFESEMQLLADERERANIELGDRVREEAAKINEEDVKAKAEIVATVENSGAELNASNQQLLANVKARLADGIETAAEAQQNATDLATVMGTIRTSIETQTRLNALYQDAFVDNNRRMSQLEQAMTLINNKINTRGPNR